MTVLISVRNLEVRKNDRVICRMDELDITQGERVVITGGNGTGKTTLLRVLAGLATDVSGRVSFSPSDIQRIYAHQHPYLFRGTVRFNIEYGLHAAGVSKANVRSHWESVVATLGLSELMEQSAKTLSGGEQRRVAFARAFVLQPEVLLLDEPFAELDTDGITRVQTLFAGFPGTVVIASPTESHVANSERVVSLRGTR